MLDPQANPLLLSLLRPDVVMLGLNISRPLDKPLSNFHDKKPQAKDFKIRYAFAGTCFYGAYMTDVLKFYVEPDSSKVGVSVRRRPEILKESRDKLLEEFEDLGSMRPTLITFGTEATRLAKRILKKKDYSEIVGVTHYSHFIGQEAYRERVRSQLDDLEELESIRAYDAAKASCEEPVSFEPAIEKIEGRSSSG